MFKALIYLLTPKQKVAEAYIKKLLNQQGYFWSKFPDGCISELATHVVTFAENMKMIGSKEAFATLIVTNSQVITFQLCDYIETGKMNPDTVDEVRAIFEKYNVTKVQAKAV